MFEAYARERAAVDAHAEWVRANTKGSYYPCEVPAHLQHVDNEMRARVELFEWCANPPEKYFAYVRETGQREHGAGWVDGGEPWQLTNWTGETLGRITRGRTWRDNLGGKRVAIWVDGTNGRQYFGTYYASAGTYARITETIDSKRAYTWHQIAITQRATGATRYASRGVLPSAEECAAMSEARFNALVREAFAGAAHG